MSPAVMVYVFIHTVVYFSLSPLSNLLYQYPMNIIKLLPYIYSSSIGSCIPVDSNQASVSTKYTTKMQVQKKYNIHNNNTVIPSEKLTQTIYVNPDVVKHHWKCCIRKQAMTVASIIG